MANFISSQRVKYYIVESGKKNQDCKAQVLILDFFFLQLSKVAFHFLECCIRITQIMQLVLHN